MGRIPLIRTAEHPYHIRARSNNKDWFDLPLDICFEVFESVLSRTCLKFHIEVHVFVLMSNHFHMIVSTPKSNIDEAMQQFMTETSRGLRQKSLRMNHVYGGRYKWSIIDSPVYYANCYRYVAQNPVRANVVSRVENYQYSSFSKNQNALRKLITSNNTGHGSILPATNVTDWLNFQIGDDENRQIRRGLKKPIFEPSVSRETRKKIDFEDLAKCGL